MTIDTLVVGTALPEYRVSAKMPADPVENKIHEDELARQYGFRGGIVPGVTVYAWMTHPVVEALGPAWLERGTFRTRFAKPVYFDEAITVRSSVAARTEEAIVIEARALNAAGEACGTATLGLPLGPVPTAPEVAAYPTAPLPTERPPVSREFLAGRTALGTPELTLDEATARGFLERVGDALSLYRGPRALAHPALYLDQANRALDRNVRVSPWIHVESEGRHLSPLSAGERLETRVKIKSLFERKGHEFVELDLLLVAEGRRPVASVRHVAIYRLRRVG